MINRFDNYLFVDTYIDNQSKLHIRLKSTSTKRIIDNVYDFSNTATQVAIRRIYKLFYQEVIPFPKKITYSQVFISKINRNFNTTKPICLEAVSRHHNTYDNYKKLASYASEYRSYKKINIDEVKLENINTDIECYELKPTERMYNLAVFQLKGNDTCYFATYNTKTMECFCSCDNRKIIEFVKAQSSLFIMDIQDGKYLNALIQGEDIRWKSMSQLSSQLAFNYISVQEILSDDKSNLIAKLAYPHMRVDVNHSEAKHCLQVLENLKFVFDRFLLDKLTIIATLERVYPNIQYINLAMLADKCFYISQDNEHTYFDTQAMVIPTMIQSVPISTGKSQLGGVRGCLTYYQSRPEEEIVHLDYSSFYPSIILKNKDLFKRVLNITRFEEFYKKKFQATRADEKSVYKSLINNAVGILGSSKPCFKMRNRKAYEFVIREGQKIMIETITSILYTNPQLKLLHVNTDGVYFSSPKDFCLSFQSHYPSAIHIYKAMYIGSNANNYMLLDKDNSVIGKGDYKNCKCLYVKQRVLNEVFGLSIPNSNKPLDFVMLDDLGRRYIMCTGKFDKYYFDTRPKDYIEKYNIANNQNIQLDINAYEALVTKLINGKGEQRYE